MVCVNCGYGHPENFRLRPSNRVYYIASFGAD